MKTALFLVLVSLVGFVGETSAQNQKAIDSLTAVLATKVAGDRYSPLYELAFEYLDKDNERALEIIEEAGEAALLSGDSLWIVKSKRVRGQILYRLGRMAEAIPFFETGLRTAGRNGFEQESEWIYSAFGLVELFRGEFDKALVKFDTAFQLAERQRDTLFLIGNLTNMGLTYYKLHDPTKALGFLFKGLKIEQRTRQPLEESWTNLNISLCYSSLHQFASAEAYLKKSRSECLDGCPERQRMHQELASGIIFYGLRQRDRALKNFFSSLSLARKRGDSRIIFDDLVKISEVLIAENRISEAERYLKDAEKLIGPKGAFPIGQIDVYSQFCQVYERMSDYRRLAFYQHKYIQLKDSVLNYELTNRLMAAEAEFKDHENKARIASQSQIILLNKGIIHRQQVLNIVTALLAVVTLAFAALIFVNFRRKQHVNRLLEQKVRQRTRELEYSRDEMLRIIQEKDLKIKHVSIAIVDSVNTIEGLCLTGRKEIPHALAHSYLERIKHASRVIAENLQAFRQDGVFQHVP